MSCFFKQETLIRSGNAPLLRSKLGADYQEKFEILTLGGKIALLWKQR